MLARPLPRSDTPTGPDLQRSFYTSHCRPRAAFRPRPSQPPPQRRAAPPTDWDPALPRRPCGTLLCEIRFLFHVRARIRSPHAPGAYCRSVWWTRTSSHMTRRFGVVVLRSRAHVLVSHARVVHVLPAAYRNTNRTDAILNLRHILLLASRPHPGRHNTTVRCNRRKLSV